MVVCPLPCRLRRAVRIAKLVISAVARFLKLSLRLAAAQRDRSAPLVPCWPDQRTPARSGDPVPPPFPAAAGDRQGPHVLKMLSGDQTGPPQAGRWRACATERFPPFHRKAGRTFSTRRQTGKFRDRSLDFSNAASTIRWAARATRLRLSDVASRLISIWPVRMNSI
jgi:hypothetical protein